ncbi:MAG: CAP domain-containing protein [Methanoregulaceae archaeon]|nr:CAP domain-containing protein [Methanoregulaceae archaeon]
MKKALISIFIAALLCCMIAYPVLAGSGDSAVDDALPPGIEVQVVTGEETGADALSVNAIATNIYNRVNIARANNGLAPLTRTTYLNNLAKGRANHMAATQNVHHDYPPYGTTPWPAFVHGENVANMLSGDNVGFPDCTGGTQHYVYHDVPDTAAGIGWGTMHMFLAHDSCSANGHRKNILKPWFTKIGVGVALGGDGLYYTSQHFI